MGTIPTALLQINFDSSNNIMHHCYAKSLEQYLYCCLLIKEVLSHCKDVSWRCSGDSLSPLW